MPGQRKIDHGDRREGAEMKSFRGTSTRHYSLLDGQFSIVVLKHALPKPVPVLMAGDVPKELTRAAAADLLRWYRRVKL
jgi:hypothetical protein